MPDQVDIEVCVDTIDGVRAAIVGGADRVELCAALSEGGLTPSLGLMCAAARENIPCFAMIRPRAGLFQFGTAEEAVMHADIVAARDAGLAGVVLGAQAADGRLDVAMLGRLKSTAEGLGLTLHRVIDVVPDPIEALDQAIALGFDRVLTSGAEPDAGAGTAMIVKMVARAQDRISVMAGCGVTAENVATLVGDTGVREVHASCARPVEGARAFSDFDPANGRMVTSPEAVRDLVTAAGVRAESSARATR